VTRVTGAVLAGGDASRYGGRPKGLERVRSTRVIDRVADALRGATDELLLIANDPAAESWLPGVRVVRDVRPGSGSVGGIHAALTHAASPVLLVAWDMPFVPLGLLRALRDLGQRDGSDAALPESRGPRSLEPLCAYYTPACIPAIEHAIDRGDLRAVGFHAEVRIARLPLAVVSTFGDPERIFMNVNTPAELALAEQYASAADGGDRRA